MQFGNHTSNEECLRLIERFRGHLTTVKTRTNFDQEKCSKVVEALATLYQLLLLMLEALK